MSFQETTLCSYIIAFVNQALVRDHLFVRPKTTKNDTILSPNKSTYFHSHKGIHNLTQDILLPQSHAPPTSFGTILLFAGFEGDLSPQNFVGIVWHAYVV